MPRKKKPKAGDEAACPQCRKLVTLIRNDQGAVVLRVHHVVANSSNGYDVNECGSSGHPPASPDEVAEGDRWQDKAPQRPGKPTAIGSTAMRAATVRQTVDVDAITGAISSATEGVSSLGEAIREATESIVRAAAATQDDFALTEEHVPTTEQMADVMRTSINGYAVRAAMTTSTVPDELRFTADGGPRIGDMVSQQPWSVDQADLVAQVLTAIRETYIDVTGAPPDDVDVSIDSSDHPDLFMQDMQVMRLRLQPGDIVLNVAIRNDLTGMPGFARARASEAAAAVRSALLQRGPGGRRECRNRHGVCTCTLPADHADRHLCACRTAWREPEADACP